MDQPQAAEPALTATHTPDVRQDDLRGIADDDVLDRAPPIDQHADLAMELGALRRELRRELAGHDLRRCDPPAVEPLERLDLAGLEAAQVPGDFLLHDFGEPTDAKPGRLSSAGNLPIAVRFATDIVPT